MKSAIIFDFAACRTQQELPAELLTTPPPCSDELGVAIELLIQALRHPPTLKQTG